MRSKSTETKHDLLETDELNTIMRVKNIEEKNKNGTMINERAIIIHGATERDSKIKEEQDKGDKDFV